MVFLPVNDINPLRSIRFQWVTVAIIAFNVVAFLLETTEAGPRVIANLAIVPAELFRTGIFGSTGHGPPDGFPVPERYTLLSYMFLHADIWHLASNMLFLWVFGDNVEDALGHFRFAVFYLVCGIGAALVHALFNAQSTLPLIGASGAIAGVIGAYLVLYPMVHVWVLALRIIPLQLPAYVVLGVWIVSQVVMVLTGTGGQTAWFAHIGGFVIGALLVIVLRRPGVPLFDRRVREALRTSRSP